MAKGAKVTKSDKRRVRQARLRLVNVIGLGLVGALTVVLLVGALTGAIRSPRPRSFGRAAATSSSPTATTGTTGTTGTPAGDPWEYDATGNRHFDPRPGHEHWHQGPPPPEDQRGPAATPLPATPAPAPANGLPAPPEDPAATPFADGE